MTFWQENYPFIKDVYIMRQTKMIEWMENVEKAISRFTHYIFIKNQKYLIKFKFFNVLSQSFSLTAFWGFFTYFAKKRRKIYNALIDFCAAGCPLFCSFYHISPFFIILFFHHAPFPHL